MQPSPVALPVLDVRILRLQDITFGPSWTGPSGARWFWRLYHFDLPGARLAWDGAPEQRLEPGRLHLVPPRHPFARRWAGPRTGRHLFCHFELELPDDLAAALCPHPLMLPHDAVMAALVSGLAGVDEAGDAAQRHRALALLHRAVDQLLRTRPAPLVHELDARLALQGPLSPAVRRMRDRLDQAPGVGELAALCGCGADHFIRRFKRAYGLTPIAWLTRERLRRATALLAGDDLTVDEIAAACGYRDRAYFSRVFARHLGCGPATWRRQAWRER